ncbi:MAG: DUF4097 family beta strand repeat protein [Lachnospiraceae bacterium]|nr:DUF4097 family beta strand repeat protein [Lachnospiraceae bacterium]
MKKFVRFCVTIILVLVIVGAILVGIGIYTVGWDEVANLAEEISDGKINLKDGVHIEGESFSKIGEILEKNAIYNIKDSTMFDKNQEMWNKDVKKTKVTEASVKDLNLEIGGCLFQLKQSEDTAYYVEYKGDGKSQAYVKGDELFVKVMNTNNIDFTEKENCFTLYVPEDVLFDEAVVQLGAGKMQLGNLQAQKMKIELGAGQILAKDFEVSDVEIGVGAGDIELEEAKLGEVKIEVGAGNCKIQGSISEDVEAECAMGNITLKINGNEEDFDYELECVSGNLKVGDMEYSGLAKETEVDNAADKKLDLKCVMGNIEVTFE